MFDPDNKKDVARLVAGIRKSRQKLGFHRDLRTKFQRQYVGRNYSREGSVKSVTPNLIEQFVSIYKRALAPILPTAFVTVSDRSLLGTRSKLQLGLNHLAREIDLQSTLELLVYDALMMVGIVKIGISRDEFRYRGFRHDTGQPFADHILFDDWVYDYAAKSWETMEYCGDRSFEPLDLVKDSFPEHADELQSMLLLRNSEFGEGRGDPVDRTMDGEQRVFDYIGIYQIWLPNDNLILIMPDSESGIRNIVLDVLEWEGPENGPYRQLGFESLPGSVMPLSPISTVFELAALHGALFRKSARQAENQKTVIAARRSSASDARKLISSDDMEVITADDPNMLKDFRFNGADPATLQMGQLVRGLFSEFSGNLQLLGGLSAQSDTLGQDRLLANNASERVKNMQKKMEIFTRGVFNDLAWWLFTDPRIDLPLVKPIPGSSESITVRFTAEDIEGDFLDYNIQIDPHSMVTRTPQEESQLLQRIFQTLVFPNQEQLLAQGVGVNLKSLLKRIGELENMKLVEEFLITVGPSALGKGTIGSPPRAQTASGGSAASSLSPNRDFQRDSGDLSSLLSMIGGQGSGGNGQSGQGFG